MNQWIGKMAVVTGASAGIGKATVETLLRHGVNVVGIARRVERIEELRENMISKSAAEGKLFPRRCDVGNEEDLVDALSWVKKDLGGIDVLVNNAGIARYTKVIDSSNLDYENILNVNVRAVAIGIREAVASMRERDVPGHIINMNSIAGHFVDIPGKSSIYAASKHAVTALTEQVRRELARQPGLKIKISSISPGLTKTEFTSASGVANADEKISKYPYLTSQEVADALKYLLETPPKVQVCELIIRSLGEP